MSKDNRDKAQAARERRNDEKEQLLARIASQLSEHFSSVQIIATDLAPDGATERFHSGSGDAHARIHACQMWARQMESLLE